jgi:hypothetical protein
VGEEQNNVTAAEHMITMKEYDYEQPGTPKTPDPDQRKQSLNSKLRITENVATGIDSEKN